MFKERISAINQWFEEWNSCEQTVALYSLIKKVNPVQAHFLANILNEVQKNGHPYIKTMEEDANSPGESVDQIFTRSLVSLKSATNWDHNGIDRLA